MRHREPHHFYKKIGSKYTKEVVEGWLPRLKELKGNREALARELGITSKVIGEKITAYNYGEL